MSDQTPRPPHDDDSAADLTPSKAGATSESAAAVPVAGGGRWYSRRVPLQVTGAALILGCVLGGGVVAVGALVGDGHSGDDRGNHNSRDDRADSRGNDTGGARHKQSRDGGGRNSDDQSTPAQSPSSSSAPAASGPAPTASA